MPRILSYGCTSSAGSGAAALWGALSEGVDLSVPHSGGRGCFFPARAAGPHTSELALLSGELMNAWDETGRAGQGSTRLGVILATTKGILDDLIWDSPDSRIPVEDPAQPLLVEFLRRSGLAPRLSICVSNACASSLSALWLAREWLEQDRVDDALVLSCDSAGRFVFSGFQSLGALTNQRVRPFSADRSGLQLGEAATAIYIDRGLASGTHILGVAIDSEGFAVTRPSTSGASLARACAGALAKNAAPGLVIAHGTGTRANDEAEDRALESIESLRDVPVTGSKWSVGHTLAASGAIDVIAACEVLKRGRAFRLANTMAADPALKCRYLTAQSNDLLAKPLVQVLVTSLGFGGVHAAALIGSES